MNILVVIFVSLLINFEVICSEKDNEEKEFVATYEWQVVRKGQKIPKGLHVRVNFETGITEAKLLDENEKTNKDNALLEILQDKEDSKLLETGVIREALKKVKGDDILKPEEMKKIKDKFRSFEQIKEELHSLNLNPKIDAEILNDLFKQYKDEIEKETIDVYAILRILEDFDFLAHQFDNALEFVRQNGFKEVIYKNLNLTNTKIKEETLKLIGSLVQNNAKVQINALETGAISTLLRILNLETSTEVKSRAVFALSCLLRRFPLAQLRFVENGGISVIMKLMERDPLKIQIKLVTLMNDLLVEHNHALKYDQNENEHMLVNQYKLVNLEKLLIEQNWCLYLDKLILSIVTTDPDDHDSIERCIIAMHTVANKCLHLYNKNQLVSLQQRYRILAKIDYDRSDEPNKSDIFTNLHDICHDILHLKNVKTEL